jgi:hypothetical protein
MLPEPPSQRQKRRYDGEAQAFDVAVEVVLVENLIQPQVERMGRTARQVLDSAYSCGMVRRIAAVERLDRTRFRSDVEYLDHVVQLAAYRCPHCGVGVEFQGRHLVEGQPFGSRAPAALDSPWRAAFDVARPLAPFEWALDFHCAGCGAPVRIVYAQMSDMSKTFDWDLLEVLETIRWPEQ